MTDPEQQLGWLPTESDYQAVIRCLMEMVGMNWDVIEAFRIRDARSRWETRITKQPNGDIVVTIKEVPLAKAPEAKVARRRKG